MKNAFLFIVLVFSLFLVSCHSKENYEASLVVGVVFNVEHIDTCGCDFIIIGDKGSNTYKVDVPDARKYKLGQRLYYILVVEPGVTPAVIRK